MTGQELRDILLLLFFELVIFQAHKLTGVNDLNGKTKMVVTCINDQPALVKLQGPCLLRRYLKSWMHVVGFDLPPTGSDGRKIRFFCG